ncbi:hypothetical protein [Rhodopirellula sp. MGV]|uniref:hypothetical protein n=1 Tax=Rhodopirellula sp. MGV TaxID=2023130 RepID=UPI000B9639A3|nr:hypothetical protein [Rhodopirellula sp. MGV]PNY36983.1 hypothetical protein C2E31_10250 [Rhodopirellula baltica]
MSKTAPDTFRFGVLQDRYLGELKEQLFQRLKREAETDESHQALMHEAGITDPVLISELSDLGITAESLVVMRMLPLVLVAWAEKAVDPSEHAAVLNAAKPLGITESSVAYVLLEHWLRQRPPAESFDAWQRYVRELTQGMSAFTRGKFIDLLRTQMTSIAKASGGHLGFGKVSRQERLLIERFITALETAE